MNELLALTCFLAAGIIIVICARFGKTFLYVISTLIIISTNATVGIQVDVFGWSLSWAVILYSMVYLITDILSEFFEKNSAYKLAASNLSVQIIFWAYVLITTPVSPSFGNETYEAMMKLFSTTPRITIAAIAASGGAFLDIFIYEKIKKMTKGKHLWFRNNISTMVGQSVNTFLFFVIALYGVLPNIWEIILFAIAVKIMIAAFDTPILYFTRRFIVVAENREKTGEV